jgi:GDP-D-mannose dehydratase
MTKKTALITGITGQEGSYLAEFLPKKRLQRATSTLTPPSPMAPRASSWTAVA